MHTQNKPDRLQFVFPFLEKKDFKKFHLTQLYLIASPNITTEANTQRLSPAPQESFKLVRYSPHICSAYFPRTVKSSLQMILVCMV